MKHLKDTRLAYYRYVPCGKNEYGVVQPGQYVFLDRVWANVKGVDYSEHFAAGVNWDRPMIKATFTKPKDFEVTLSDYIVYQGRPYAIKSIDYLTGQPGRDIKVTCQYDPHSKLS